MTDPNIVTTRDGSPTLYSTTYRECYHSVSGAYEEAFHKFVRPSGLADLSKKRDIKLLDICFGLGYNSLVSLDHCSKSHSISITAIEQDPSILQKAVSIRHSQSGWTQILGELRSTKSYHSVGQSINLIIADARKVLSSQKGSYDIVYLDPFSTQKNAELWTRDFFMLIKENLSPQGIILTYSSALPVRSGLLRSGFYVYETEPVDGKRGGTLASLTQRPDEKSLSLAELNVLCATVATIPYRDRTLKSGSSEILSQRNRLLNYMIKKKKLKKVNRDKATGHILMTEH
ncbi:MAG: MnmC family methyltransferase [Spirochaetota bacterium]|nr:MnmC family methyltransferase [Spirochaetota bacterium]